MNMYDYVLAYIYIFYRKRITHVKKNIRKSKIYLFAKTVFTFISLSLFLYDRWQMKTDDDRR